MVVALVAVGEEEDHRLPLVPDREKARDERVVAVAVVATITTAAAVDAIAAAQKGRRRKKKQPLIQTQRLVRKVRKA